MPNAAVTTPPPLPKAADTMFCFSCGKATKSEAEICPFCGVRPKKGADKTALALLAFFLGGIGGHKFYVGKYGQGILYLLFCWTGIPGLIALIEFIIYLCTPGEDIARKYDSRGPGGVVLLVVGFLGFIFMAGVLTAIAVPNFIAYQNKAVCAQVESQANKTLYALSEFYADPGRSHVPSFDELAQTTGLQPDESIAVQLEGEPGEILIQFYHTSGTCLMGESFVVSLSDQIVAQWQ